MKVALVARSVFPLHGYGGLERSVHDLVRHLAIRGVDVTLIDRTNHHLFQPLLYGRFKL